MSAHFGALTCGTSTRVHSCGYVTDVSEPAAVDDEFITRDYIRPQPTETPSRMRTFICVLQLPVVLDGVGRTTTQGLR